ncbi:hypothetical protein QNH39_13155 [Neobacillus novalis]|uniref:Uncharacterized protein n=1 Tax=Neobacillus novalis TaxID=220687 RepID=A0AA95MUE1_9BACI|nr:hypothetical protein [Neobacillus novalis]WHY88719.1 hypothetical protein QNH39_13155 [Neobacillus novalis]
MSSDNVWTSNRKEAYEFAKLLTVVDGIGEVFVSKSDTFEFSVFFDIKNNVHEHSLYVEIAHLLTDYELNGINTHGEKWARAFKEVRGEA